MLFLDRGPLLDRVIEISATDLKHRQPMPKHMLISFKPLRMALNAAVHNRSVDLLHRFDPLFGTEQTEAAGACGKPFFYCCHRPFRISGVLMDSGDEQIPSHPERIGAQHIFEYRDGLSRPMATDRLQHCGNRFLNSLAGRIWNHAIKNPVHRPQSGC